MTFVPGKSGNPGGRPKNKPWADALRQALSRAKDTGTRKSLDALAEKILEEAAAGNLQALLEIGNRLDGRPPNVHEGSTSGAPIRLEVYTGVPREGEDLKRLLETDGEPE